MCESLEVRLDVFISFLHGVPGGTSSDQIYCQLHHLGLGIYLKAEVLKLSDLSVLLDMET